MSSLPLVEQIAVNLLAACQGITIANGFANNLTVQRMTPNPPSPANGLVIVEWFSETPIPTAAADVSASIEAWVLKAYVRESDASTGAADTAWHTVWADLKKAILADPRRGGLTDANTIFAGKDKTEKYATELPGIIAIVIPVLVEVRTLWNDPTTKAPPGNQLYWESFAEISYARYLAPNTLGPRRRWRNLKVIPIVEPRLEITENDSGGLAMPRHGAVECWNEKYEVETQDFSLPALLLFLGSESTGTLTQAGGSITAAQMLAGVDSVVLLTDDAGNRVYGVTAITSITSLNGSVVYSAGTDFIPDPSALALGILEIPAASTIPPGKFLATFAAPAISGQRTIAAQSTGELRFRVEIVWPGAVIDGVPTLAQFRGPVDMAIAPAHGGRGGEGLSSNKFHLIVMDDGSDTPAGQLVMPLGTIPAVGS